MSSNPIHLPKASLSHLVQNNRAWAERTRAADNDFFESLAYQQTPQYMWIGCADSRVPANDLIGVKPGEVFVHRNVANIIIPSDLNCLSAMQYAVDILKVKHIIVCGHYGCGGIKTVLNNQRVGLVDNWLRHIHDIRIKYTKLMAKVTEPETKFNRLCELNVLEQVLNACQSTVIQDAWDRGQELTVHSWIYNLHDGLINPLGLEANNMEQLIAQYEHVLQKMRELESEAPLPNQSTPD